MQRDPVDSSVLAALGYEETTSTLEVEFRSGRVYHYYAVPPSVYRALLSAPSHGRFFNNSIRGEYPYQRRR